MTPRYTTPMLMLVLLILVTLAFVPATIAADLACMDEELVATASDPGETGHGLPDSHWMPPIKLICSYSQIPPAYVCNQDPLCWCFWAWDVEKECYWLQSLVCA